MIATPAPVAVTAAIIKQQATKSMRLELGGIPGVVYKVGVPIKGHKTGCWKTAPRQGTCTLTLTSHITNNGDTHLQACVGFVDIRYHINQWQHRVRIQSCARA